MTVFILVDLHVHRNYPSFDHRIWGYMPCYTRQQGFTPNFAVVLQHKHDRPYQHCLPRKQQVELRCRLRSFPNGACLLADVDDIEVYAK